MMKFKLLLRTFLLFIIRKSKAVLNNLNLNKIVDNPDHLEDLAPMYNADPDCTYSNALNWALSNPEVKNIAMTGPYGSGKSSIIRTFERKYSEYKFLNISLATFDEKSIDSDDQQKKIEVSILQQMFYKVGGRQLPDSRFRRIKTTSYYLQISRALALLLWATAAVIVFYPDFFCRLPWWERLYIRHYSVIVHIALGIFILIVFLLLTKIFRQYHTARFNKVNLTGGEIELAPETDSSIMNKYLDEILYFFERTDYDVVVFEDLDRFKDPEELFTKLRELNNLINGSKPVGRMVRFIYALKDDVFADKSRTKFFDFLIPVIPVINYSNSGEILARKFNESGNKGTISEKFIGDITLFVEDMRMLYNIYNEYILYKKKIGLNLEEEKLLGLIVYKNFYPTDFAELHINVGKVYLCFDGVKKEIKRQSEEIDFQINAIEDEIKGIDTERSASEKELRSVYIQAVFENLPNADRLILGGKNITAGALADPDTFEELRSQSTITYNQSNYGAQNSRIKFEDVEKDVHPTLTYDNRIKQIKQRAEGAIEGLKSEIAALKIKKIQLQNQTLVQLLKDTPDSPLIENIKDDELLKFLLRNGYIDETYHSYISYFYEGKIARTDMEFVMSIKYRKPKEFDYKVKNPAAVFAKLNSSEYSQPEILNFTLLDYLANQWPAFKDEFSVVIGQISKQQPGTFDFLQQYLASSSEAARVVNQLCKQWQGLWEFVAKKSGLTQDRKDAFLKLIVEYADLEDLKKMDIKETLSNALLEIPEVLTYFPDSALPQLKKLLVSLNIRFKHLVYQSLRQDLFDFIYENDLYDFNGGVIRSILSVKYTDDPEMLDKLESQNYTIIMSSGCKKMIDYVNENIELYTKSVVLTLSENTQESVESVKALLNATDIIEEDRSAILKKENVLLNSLTDVPDFLHSQLFEQNKIAANWENIREYYNTFEEPMSILIPFLNDPTNFELLSKHKIGKTDDEHKDLTSQVAHNILTANELSDEAYGKLLNSIPWVYRTLEFGGLNEKKVDLLLDNNKLVFTKANYDLLKEKFSGKNIRLLLQDYQKFLDSEDEFDLDEIDYSLLFMSSISLDQKLAILTEMDIELITKPSSADGILSIVLKGKPAFEFNLIEKLFKLSRSSNRSQLIIFYLNSLSFEQIDMLLNLLGGDFVDVAKKGPRPKIERTPENENLINALQNRKYISSSDKGPKTIRVNTRKK